MSILRVSCDNRMDGQRRRFLSGRRHQALRWIIFRAANGSRSARRARQSSPLRLCLPALTMGRRLAPETV